MKDLLLFYYPKIEKKEQNQTRTSDTYIRIAYFDAYLKVGLYI